jgi:hypothetical protein
MFVTTILTKFYISTSNEFKNYIVVSYCGLTNVHKKATKRGYTILHKKP